VSADLLSRLGEVSQKVGAASQAMGDTLLAVARQDGGDLDVASLRDFAHRLISLAGDLTSMGVEMARRADEGG
jgi:hypothetical protein